MNTTIHVYGADLGLREKPDTIAAAVVIGSKPEDGFIKIAVNADDATIWLSGRGLTAVANARALADSLNEKAAELEAAVLVASMGKLTFET